MISEIHLHKSVKHKSVCQLDRAFEDEENVYMLLELCSNGVLAFSLRTCSTSSRKGSG
jgi:cell cycle serine/threonine-protein kinase CDC5/MSD2